MKIKNIIKIFLIIFCLLVPFMVLTSFDLSIKNEYKDFYYAELSNMYNRLKTTEGKKVVIIGNSNVSFGVESKLFEELFDDSSYSVVNFGLYGAIGTKAMLDLAKKHINKDDIIILIPEEYNQSMSLYFSAKEMWYALDSNRSMFFDLDSRSKEALVGNYVDYVAKKVYSHKNISSTSNLGVYSVHSFDERCDMTNYDREYNIMFNDYDENNPIDLNSIIIDDNFFNYINEYNLDILKKGAQMYYSFSPMNKESIVNNQEDIDKFYETLKDKIHFPIISDINNYILEKEWFYDSNYHLNTSGMKLRTYMLVNDLKNELGITTKTDFKMVEKPVKPNSEIVGEGNNSCSDCFTYEKNGNYYKITGLTELGLTKEELIIPYQVDGIYVSEFSKEVFQNNTIIKKITIQSNIQRIYDNSFSPSNISVGFSLLNGTNTFVYVSNEVKTNFIGDYFWGNYQERIRDYEKD